MAQPAVSTHEERTEFLGVPVVWPKPSPDPPCLWETWIRQFFLAINLREHCDPKDLLAGPAEVYDDPPPRPEKIPASENETERNNRFARDQAEIRKVNEINIERRKKGHKLGQIIFYHEADQRVKSCLFFALGTEGKKRFLPSCPHTILSGINFKELFTQCDGLFNKEKKIIVERMHLYNISMTVVGRPVPTLKFNNNNITFLMVGSM